MTLLFFINYQKETQENKAMLVKLNIKNCSSSGSMKSLQSNKRTSHLIPIYLKNMI